MSKQHAAREAQNYRTTSNTCSTCSQFTSEIVLPPWCVQVNNTAAARGASPTYVLGKTHGGVETRLRCKLGDFAVKKSATCDCWQKKQGATDGRTT